MPCAWKTLSIACDNLHVPTLMLLPLHKGKDDKISTCVVGMFMTGMCQWWLLQTMMKFCMRNRKILGSRILEKSRTFVE